MAQTDRLSGDAEGVGRRRRTRHARRDPARGDGRGVRALPGRSRRPPSATTRSSWRRSCRGRATSRSRSWATARATSCTSSSATARCSCATRRWSRWRPRPSLDDALRQRILADAVTLARAAAYENAGTVEFLVDPESGRALLHRMQSAHPGRAHDHRAGHGTGPRRSAVPDRRGRLARRDRPRRPEGRRTARAASRSRRASWRKAPARSPPIASRPVRACGSMPAAISGWRRRRSSIPCWPR